MLAMAGCSVIARQQRGLLDGTWIGHPEGYDNVRYTMVVTDDEFVTTVKVDDLEPHVHTGTLKVRKSGDHYKIDNTILSSSIPRYVGKTSLGLFSLDGDTLTMVVNDPGNESRPKSFVNPGDAVVAILVRAE